MYFEILCIIHILIWLFVLTAFLDKNLAYYNIYYVIPAIYIVHILPVHIINTLKEKCYPYNYKKYEEEFYETLIIPKIFRSITKELEEFCFASPLSTQGMLIFGLLTSIFVLHPPLYFQ